MSLLFLAFMLLHVRTTPGHTKSTPHAPPKSQQHTRRDASVDFISCRSPISRNIVAISGGGHEPAGFVIVLCLCAVALLLEV
jgi:hypothetical protein